MNRKMRARLSNQVAKQARRAREVREESSRCEDCGGVTPNALALVPAYIAPPRRRHTGLHDELPEHEWGAASSHCIHCGVSQEAVEDGMVIKGCGVRRAKEQELAKQALAGFHVLVG